MTAAALYALYRCAYADAGVELDESWEQLESPERAAWEAVTAHMVLAADVALLRQARLLREALEDVRDGLPMQSKTRRKCDAALRRKG
jgi:hypothetical protein